MNIKRIFFIPKKGIFHQWYNCFLLSHFGPPLTHHMMNINKQRLRLVFSPLATPPSPPHKVTATPTPTLTSDNAANGHKRTTSDPNDDGCRLGPGSFSSFFQLIINVFFFLLDCNFSIITRRGPAGTPTPTCLTTTTPISGPNGDGCRLGPGSFFFFFSTNYLMFFLLGCNSFRSSTEDLY
jgi:hypothetical protein